MGGVAATGMAMLLTAELPPERLLPFSLVFAALAVLSLLSLVVGVAELRDGMRRTFRHPDGTPASPVDIAKERDREETNAQFWELMTSAHGAP